MGLCSVVDPCLPAARHGLWQPGCKKTVSGLNFFLEQISRRPCQHDMSLGIILLMSSYSSGHY
jgi:hypothetical protein